ncbi:MAG TPA: hypothetical protein VEG34_18860, partial [Thermoanaerobaculia bacterium]|nr:hypothetical protein [Thermoanaerobaculia bacterium]
MLTRRRLLELGVAAVPALAAGCRVDTQRQLVMTDRGQGEPETAGLGRLTARPGTGRAAAFPGPGRHPLGL